MSNENVKQKRSATMSANRDSRLCHKLHHPSKLSKYYLTHPKLTSALLLAALISSLTLCLVIEAQQPQQSPHRPWLRQRPSRAQQQASTTASPTAAAPVAASSASAAPIAAIGSAQEISAPINSPVAVGPINSASVAPIVLQAQPTTIANRTTRTADIFQNGDGYNLFVTTACERESMKVNIKTSRPFYGVIHTRNQRQKPICTVEGNGDTEYGLEFSLILNSQDPNYCGVIRARRDSPEDKDVLSVVVAVRFHRTIELSDDKFFLLNCTNRCRKPDCSTPLTNAKLFDPDDSISHNNGRLSETEDSPRERENANGIVSNPDECTIWKFPWVITLLWCLGILLLAMIISHCIMCSSVVCRCVRTEVEEKEPSVYEGATDYEDDLYNKRHPYRIDYDNKDIYKTSNNYAPYTLEEAQTKSTSRQKHRKGTR